MRFGSSSTICRTVSLGLLLSFALRADIVISNPQGSGSNTGYDNTGGAPIYDIEQVRIGGIRPGGEISPVPEPAAIGLLGTVIIALTGRRRFQKRT